MKRYGNLWAKLISFEALLRAAEQACKGKRFRPDVAAFHFNLEHELWALHEELAHLLHKFHYVYGLSSQLISLHGNCGFGAANNAGVPLARAKDVVLTNPDCFLDADSLSYLLDEPFAAGRLRGAALRYENGSLMHTGMCFDVDPIAGTLAVRAEPAAPWSSSWRVTAR